MSDIRIGNHVQAPDEPFMRVVTALDGEFATCERLPKGQPRRIRTSELRKHGPSGTMRFSF